MRRALAKSRHFHSADSLYISDSPVSSIPVSGRLARSGQQDISISKQRNLCTSIITYCMLTSFQHFSRSTRSGVLNIFKADVRVKPPTDVQAPQCHTTCHLVHLRNFPCHPQAVPHLPHLHAISQCDFYRVSVHALAPVWAAQGDGSHHVDLRPGNYGQSQH